jgi:hypothetical protein
MVNIKSYRFTILIIFIFHSCQNDIDTYSVKTHIVNDVNTENANPFFSEISDLKEIHFPVNLHCEIIVDSPKYIDNNKDPFFEEGEFLVSKYVYPNFVAILSYYVGDYNYPYFKTYSNTGKQIDSIYLFNGHCDEDGYGKSEAYSILNKNSIIQTDTSTYFNFDNGNKITDSIIVTESAIKIDSLGSFIKT